MTKKESMKLIANWWLKGERTQATYDKEVKVKNNISYDKALEYLEESEVQELLKQDFKSKQTIRMLELYESMYEKALKGDVKSAEWIEKFNKSDFFGKEKSEIDIIMDNLKLE